MPRFLQFLWIQHELIQQMSQREIARRYRGAALGWTWSLITPILMLGVYTLVFSGIFQSRWSQESGSNSTLDVAVNIFVGMISFGLLGEAANQAPAAITSKPNYVTKIVFPLESIPVAIVCSAAFNAATSLGVLLAFELFSGYGIKLSSLWLPLVWVPLACLSMATCWCLSALGVYLRDLGQLVGIMVSMLMFLSAVFYPVSALPYNLLTYLNMNPMIHIIDQSRRVLIQGLNPDPAYLAVGCTLGILACEISFRAFLRAKRGFADVL